MRTTSSPLGAAKLNLESRYRAIVEVQQQSTLFITPDEELVK